MKTRFLYRYHDLLDWWDYRVPLWTKAVLIIGLFLAGALLVGEVG